MIVGRQCDVRVTVTSNNCAEIDVADVFPAILAIDDGKTRQFREQGIRAFGKAATGANQIADLHAGLVGINTRRTHYAGNLHLVVRCAISRLQVQLFDPQRAAPSQAWVEEMRREVQEAKAWAEESKRMEAEEAERSVD